MANFRPRILHFACAERNRTLDFNGGSHCSLLANSGGPISPLWRFISASF
jgi:hypothetical protein